MGDRIVTKREILLSVAIVCVMVLFGFLISDTISDSVMAKHQKYNTALQINGNKELFEYGMRTNVGSAFVYGELKAIDTVGYEEIQGEYSYVSKVKYEYTRHRRTVTDDEGETKTEYYWTWDNAGEWSKHSTRITFLDVEFDYNEIKFPSVYEIDTIMVSDKVKYVYYGSPSKCLGTIYTELKDNTINGTNFYNNSSIEETIKSLESNWELTLFWIGWVLLTLISVIGFYIIDNRWLNDE